MHGSIGIIPHLSIECLNRSSWSTSVSSFHWSTMAGIITNNNLRLLPSKSPKPRHAGEIGPRLDETNAWNPQPNMEWSEIFRSIPWWGAHHVYEHFMNNYLKFENPNDLQHGVSVEFKNCELSWYPAYPTSRVAFPSSDATPKNRWYHFDPYASVDIVPGNIGSAPTGVCFE